MSEKPGSVGCSIDPREFNAAVGSLRAFFAGRGFIEVHTNHRLSILAACEDPTTIGTFSYAGELWPLPQTGQMWLEHELLSDPTLPGVFCVSTSFRNEPNPQHGRHDLIFPMCEFETHGGLEVLCKLEIDLLRHLGFIGQGQEPLCWEYDRVAEFLDVREIDWVAERRIGEELSKVFMLQRFPISTSPFWNMARCVSGSHAQKVDVILHGVETIGSAERSCDPDEMRHGFMTISGGKYADLLFSQFGRDRVLAELDDFLSSDFIPRCGGGIGMTRMIRALKLSGLLGGQKPSCQPVSV